MVGRATHYGLNVSEMDAALGFYRDQLDFEVDRRFPISDVQSNIVDVNGVEGEIVFLDTGEFEIELISYSAPNNKNVHDRASGHDVGVAHLCLTIEDIEDLYSDLQEDIKFVSEPQTISNGAQIAYARDPDGNYVEFYEPPAEE